MTTRLIHRSAASPARDIAECLEGLFLSELLDPGTRLFVVSPWMSDFPAIDNRQGSYVALVPDWPPGMINFSAVLRALLVRGVVVRLACGPGERESELVTRIERGADLDGTSANLSVHRLPRDHRLFSHEKALVADTWAVYGSMNLTYSGVSMNGELITVTSDSASVAKVATELVSLFE
ncbi:phospholipase D-like domain-containing protein DpdK [Actinokineospora sp. NPDC004072]